MKIRFKQRWSTLPPRSTKRYMKSLKIPKGQSESVYRRRTDNTMAKRKSTKEQEAIYKILHRKLKIEQREKNHEMT